MLTAGSALAIFVMFGLSSLAILWSNKFKIPHTVVLVIVGLVIGLISQFPVFHFFNEFTFTPELLFFLLLPALIFESAYNINVRKMVDSAGIILILSVVSLLVSTIVIGTALYFLLALFAIHIPFIITLLFGALISATDPVAVLSLFKEIDTPRRLSLVFEGESLFNDATAVALFLVLFGVASFGYEGFDTVVEGMISFSSMMIGGVIFGVVIGFIFTKLVGYVRENEVASITLTLVLAHTTFIVTEIMSHKLVVGDYHLYLSPIIATTIAALLMGNYGRSKIHPRAEEFVEKFWGQLAFLSNSLIFILIGILAVSVIKFDLLMIVIILATVLIVAIARAISIYPVVGLYNKSTTPDKVIPKNWQHLLSWGSLRGALAVTMVLLIPDDFMVSNWDFIVSPKEFLLSLTIGCILATLLVKATTIKKIINKLKLDTLTEIEKVEIQEARAIVNYKVNERIKVFQERGYIDASVVDELTDIHKKQYDMACQELFSPNNKAMSMQVFRMYAIGIELSYLKELYHYQEVNEYVYKKIYGKLQLQLETIESGNLNPDLSLHTDEKDIFSRLEVLLIKLFGGSINDKNIDDLYMYYRAQSIISRKVLKQLKTIDQLSAEDIFTKEALNYVVNLYQSFKEQNDKKMNSIANTHVEHYQKLSYDLAVHKVHKIQKNVLHELYNSGLVTPKLYAQLSDEMSSKD